MTEPVHMRTPMRRVRGLGAAHSGTQHFWYQRVTSVADLPLLQLTSDSGETFPVDDPATGETIREVRRMGAAAETRARAEAGEARPGSGRAPGRARG